jgi:hypothetical protein
MKYISVHSQPPPPSFSLLKSFLYLHLQARPYSVNRMHGRISN